MRIAVYGTLRKGQYNFKRFQSGLEYIDTVRINGFELWDIGLPVVIPQDSSIVVDLLEVTDVDVGRMIDMMELGAGYYITTVEINKTPYKIYPYNLSNYYKETPSKIPNGDYVKWKKQS